MANMMMVIAMMLAAAKGDPLDDARKGFNNCLIEAHNKAVDEKIKADDFTKKAEADCTAQQTAYSNMLIKSELGFKSTQAAAEKYAKEEVQLMLDSIVTSFKENTANSDKVLKLSPEK